MLVGNGRRRDKMSGRRKGREGGASGRGKKETHENGKEGVLAFLASPGFGSQDRQAWDVAPAGAAAVAARKWVAPALRVSDKSQLSDKACGALGGRQAHRSSAHACRVPITRKMHSALASLICPAFVCRVRLRGCLAALCSPSPPPPPEPLARPSVPLSSFYRPTRRQMPHRRACFSAMAMPHIVQGSYRHPVARPLWPGKWGRRVCQTVGTQARLKFSVSLKRSLVPSRHPVQWLAYCASWRPAWAVLSLRSVAAHDSRRQPAVERFATCF